MYKDTKRKVLMDTYTGMLGRCYRPNHISYPQYGAKGIYVCDEWLNSFESFINDMGARPDGMTLDRIDGSGPYSKANCRWATIQQQVINRKTTILVQMMGRTNSIAGWCREVGISPQVVCYRMKRFGMSAENALSIPASTKTRKLPIWKALKRIPA